MRQQPDSVCGREPLSWHGAVEGTAAWYRLARPTHHHLCITPTASRELAQPMASSAAGSCSTIRVLAFGS